MNLKVIILILNALYLIVAISWAIINISFETVLAIIGGLISLITFFVANNNSFIVINKTTNKRIINPKKLRIDLTFGRKVKTKYYIETNH